MKKFLLGLTLACSCISAYCFTQPSEADLKKAALTGSTGATTGGVDINESAFEAEASELVEMMAQVNAPEYKMAKGEKWPLKSLTVGKKTFMVADVADEAAIYKQTVNKANCFFVISKKEYRLYVYEVTNKDTALVAHFPVCYAKYPEGKTKQGDMRTPDCDMQKPFKVSQICDASGWKHDFKDGRGAFPAYGAWFIRLSLVGSNNTPSVCSNRSIGIHGSTGNSQSVPGRDSEGCIRLRDADIKTLKSNYVQVGTKVVVKPYTKGKYGFEKRAEKKLGAAYKAQKPGNPLLK